MEAAEVLLRVTNGIPVVTEANTKKQSGIPVVRQRYASGTPKSKKESKKENKNKITTLSSKSKTVAKTYPHWFEDFWGFWVATTGNGDKKFGGFQELQTVLVGVARFALGNHAPTCSPS